MGMRNGGGTLAISRGPPRRAGTSLGGGAGGLGEAAMAGRGRAGRLVRSVPRRRGGAAGHWQGALAGWPAGPCRPAARDNGGSGGGQWAPRRRTGLFMSGAVGRPAPPPQRRRRSAAGPLTRPCQPVELLAWWAGVPVEFRAARSPRRPPGTVRGHDGSQSIAASEPPASGGNSPRVRPPARVAPMDPPAVSGALSTIYGGYRKFEMMVHQSNGGGPDGRRRTALSWFHSCVRILA